MRFYISLCHFSCSFCSMYLIHTISFVKGFDLFIGGIYILKFILPILTTISKCFQAGLVSFAKIVPTLQYAKEQLTEVATKETPITELKQVNVHHVFVCLVV